MKQGDFVRKPKGYRFDGVVLAAFTNTTGGERVAVENGDGMIHIFDVKQLVVDDSARVDFDARRAPPSPPVCTYCEDTHTSPISGHMCTSCPVPCQTCRAGGFGAYCETTPCACPCHDKKKR